MDAKIDVESINNPKEDVTEFGTVIRGMQWQHDT